MTKSRYIEDEVRVAVVGSGSIGSLRAEIAMPGDWAFGGHFGAMQEETHAFINSTGTGRPDPILATGYEGMDVLPISQAVDESARTAQVVPLTWAG